jgi:hypothetical protein
MLTTSLPDPASLIAKLPTFFPATKSGRYFAFCSSVPCRWIWFTHRFECAPYESATEPDARDSSSMAMRCSKYPRPKPP